MRHNIPPTTAFRDSPATDPIQEVALRVIVELPDWQLSVLGTAVFIAGHLAITARHVLEAAIRKSGATSTLQGLEVTGFSLRLYQVLPGPSRHYRIWNVSRAWIASSDIAILHVGLDSTSEAADTEIGWKVLRLRVMPPPSGQKVLAYGYREGKIEVADGADGTHHIVLNDVGTTSIGEVGQVFPERRDSSMLTFPCFEVHARFAHGMSGGMVVDENGAICGLICSGTEFSDSTAAPLSYAATLWPMLKTVISADRGNLYPRGVEYPVIDLALDKIIDAVGLEELEPNHFPGKSLPQAGH
jgi:Trypsin-like peptidase domain